MQKFLLFVLDSTFLLHKSMYFDFSNKFRLLSMYKKNNNFSQKKNICDVNSPLEAIIQNTLEDKANTIT
jgi:hypothetical protein